MTVSKISKARAKKRARHIIERVKANKSYIHPKNGVTLSKPIIDVPAHERHTLIVGEDDEEGQLAAWGCPSLEEAMQLLGVRPYSVLP